MEYGDKYERVGTTEACPGPCPVCGHKGEVNYSDFTGKWYVSCEACHACGSTDRKYRRAVEAWNRRSY